MFGLPSLRIGTIFGIPLEVNPTWLIIFVLVTATLALSYFPAVAGDTEIGLATRLAMGAVTALLFFASIVVHELSHSLVARAGGLRISKVTLFIFGGVSQMEDEPRRPGHEFLLAAAGPFSSVLLSALFAAMYVVAMAAGAPFALYAPLLYLAFINASVAVFNLLPGFPLDGGRVLRAALWAATGDLLKATRWASRAGQGIGLLLIGAAVAGVLGGMPDLIWLGLLGWFLTGLAENAYRQQVMRSALEDVPVSDVMSRQPVTVPAEITLEQLAHDYFLGERHSRYPVVSDGRVVGLVTLAGAKRVPRERWSSVSVGEVAEREMERLVVAASSPVVDAAERLGPEDPGALLVTDAGAIVGIVTREDVVRALRVRS